MAAHESRVRNFGVRCSSSSEYDIVYRDGNPSDSYTDAREQFKRQNH